MTDQNKVDVTKVRVDNVQPLEKRGGWFKPVQQQVVQMQPTNQQPQQSAPAQQKSSDK